MLVKQTIPGFGVRHTQPLQDSAYFLFLYCLILPIHRLKFNQFP